MSKKKLEKFYFIILFFIFFLIPIINNIKNLDFNNAKNLLLKDFYVIYNFESLIIFIKNNFANYLNILDNPIFIFFIVAYIFQIILNKIL